MKIFTFLSAFISLAIFSSTVFAQTYYQQSPEFGFQTNSAIETSPTAVYSRGNNAKSSTQWTLQFTHSIASISTGQAGIETDGTYFYLPVWNNDTIYKLNMSGALVEKFVIPGVTHLRDLAYDGTYFYGGAASNTIYKMDFTNKTLIATITAPSGVHARHIAYDPINNALWCGNWTTDIWLVSATNGTVLDTIPAIGSPIAGTYGSAFDTISTGGPYLWLFDQSGSSLTTLYRVNVATKQYNGYSYDISNDINIASGASAGGLFIQPGVVSGTVTLGGLVQGDLIFGYDLASAQPNSIDIGVTQILSPTTGYNKSNNESVSVIVKNYGASTVNSYDVAYTVNGGTAVSQSVTTSIAPFAVDTISFTTTVDMSTQGSYNFNCYTVLASDIEHNNDTISQVIEHLSPENTFPYAESFESGFGGWIQSTNDIIDWTRYSGTTPSGGTGPATGASNGNYYLYIETSSPVATGDSAILSMPFNFSSLVEPFFKFDYNMTGSGVGELYVNIFDGTTTHYKVWSKSGAQAGDWNTDSIDLAPYKSSNYVEIQIVAVKGTNYQSDISIDNFKLYDNYVPYYVMVVDDDNNGSTDESFRIDTALVHAGAIVTSFDIGSGATPTYDTLKHFDLVIWSTANDGTTNLWDVSDTATLGDGAIKFNAALTQYLDSNGTVWIDGVDFIYDVYGGAPRNFTSGDFVYDVMGINNYVAQSHADAPGLPMALKVPSATMMNVDTVRWKYSSLWYGDAFDITATATPLYEMGPSTYVLAGKINALYQGKVITSSLRIGALGDGSNYDQSEINQLVAGFITLIKAGLPAKTGDLTAPNVSTVTAVNDSTVSVDFSEAMNATATDTANYSGLSGINTITLNAAATQATISLSTKLVDGQSNTITIVNAEDASGNIMDAPQTFNFTYTVPVIIPKLVITEIMYNGPESGTDTTEFIEIYNNDTMAVNLDGYYFAKGVTYTLPNYVLDTNSYFVVSYDSLKFANFYGKTAYQWTSGGLSNGGEKILLVNPQGDTVDFVHYDDVSPWPTSPDGNGPSLTFCNPNLDNNNGANWSAATTYVGMNAAGDSIWANPGEGCGNIVPPPSGDTIPPIVNNATVSSATAIEVYFSEAVDTTAENVANYTGLGTVSNAIRNTNGDMVTLTLANALTDGVNNTLTVANIKDTSGNVMVAPQNFNLIYNASVANMLITEIMYNDPSGIDSLEYFEIYNNGSSAANIGGYEVTQGVHFVFPGNTNLAAGDYMVIAKDSALVNSVFGISGTLQWTSGGLKNSGEDIAIENSVGDTIAYVNYDDASPWPVGADGQGPSMEFCDKTLDNNNGANWSLSTKFVSVFNGDSIFGTPGADCYHDAIFGSVSNNTSINVYPNPATEVIHISTDGATYELSIYNISGSLVKRTTIKDVNNSISLKSLQSGMYYMQFINTKTANRMSKKLIIQ